jgi:uncharacterized surface protein with fasciclin (FAS1) repeats
MKHWMFTLGMALLLGAACKKSNNNSTSTTPGTITDVVSSDTSFSILKGAVVSAGLATTLSGAGPFTVFAPNNAAFAASGLSAAAVSSLSGATLNTLLLYHTIPAKIMASQVPAGPDAKVITASGDSVFVTNTGTAVYVNGVAVTKADVPASNGVIHVIASVLQPAIGNIVQTAQADTVFSYLVAAITRASTGTTNVAAVLSSGGIFTVFAPTNNAFRAAGFATISAINAADPNTLASILTYHVVAGRVFSSDLTNGAKPATVNGETLTISIGTSAQVKGNGNTTAATITSANIVATNGVIHVIDQVLLP